MLAFGLASVPFFNGLYAKWNEIPVELPQLVSETPIYVFPRYTNEMPCTVSHCGGFIQPTSDDCKKHLKQN
jgi:hypothetical protein